MRITRIKRDESLSRCLSRTINRRAAFERELRPSAPVEDMAMGICRVGLITDKQARNVIPAKPGTMTEDGGVWNTSNNTLG